MSERDVDTELVVGGRFRGPARSGNGGYTSGALAALAPRHWPAVTVRLSQPPPLELVMSVARSEDLLVASHDGREVARATRAEPVLRPVASVDAATARAAEASYPGLRTHPFPTCFTCGTGREPGDGLRVFPGLVGDGRAAATWTPHPSLAADRHEDAEPTREANLAVTWAALDCTGAWACDVGERPMVLGTMTARVDRLPAIGEEHVVVGEAREEHGRRQLSATSLYDSAGDLVATAEHVWVRVDPAAFN